MIVYHSGRSKNVQRFVEKTGLPSTKLELGAPCIVKEPFILLTPTYADGEGKGAIPPSVREFLAFSEINRSNTLALVGSGNKNFGWAYCLSAVILSKKLNVPLMMTFELAGTPEDVTAFQEEYRGYFPNE